VLENIRRRDGTLARLAARNKTPYQLYISLLPYANPYTAEEKIAFLDLLRRLDAALEEVRGEEAALKFWRLWRKKEIDYWGGMRK